MNIRRLHFLAQAALAFDDNDWGTESQIAAENAFYEAIKAEKVPLPDGFWYEHLKSTSDERVLALISRIPPAPNLLEKALQTDNLDAALGMLMGAIGISDGGVAGIVFTGEWRDTGLDGDKAWEAGDADARREMLSHWFGAEALWCMRPEGGMRPGL